MNRKYVHVWEQVSKYGVGMSQILYGDEYNQHNKRAILNLCWCFWSLEPCSLCRLIIVFDLVSLQKT